jgi:hypothetical protein
MMLTGTGRRKHTGRGDLFLVSDFQSLTGRQLAMHKCGLQNPNPSITEDRKVGLEMRRKSLIAGTNLEPRKHI